MRHEFRSVVSEMVERRKRNQRSRVGIRGFMVLYLILAGARSNTVYCQDAAVAADGKPPSLVNVTTAWWDRESRIKTAEMSWHVVTDSAAGDRNFQVEFPCSIAGKPSFIPQTIQLSDRQFSHTSQRWYVDLHDEFAGYDRNNLFPTFVDGMKRDHDDVRKWHRPPYQYRLFWDQSTHRECFASTAGTPSLGVIRDSSDSLLLNAHERVSPGLMIWPALIAFRPTIALGVSPQNPGLAMQAEPSDLGNRRCLVITGKPSEERTFRLWVAVDEGFSVVRAMIYWKAQIREQIDTTYAHKGPAGWCPTAWEIMVFNHDREFPGQDEIYRCARVEVDDCTINGQVDESQFNVEFPADAIVNDKTSNKIFVVQKEGASRAPDPAELRLLMGTAVPSLDDASLKISRETGIYCALVVSCVALWGLRRRRIGRSQEILQV